MIVAGSPLALADYRRRVSELYDRVRSARDPHAGWDIWRETRDALFADHPCSPWHGEEREPPIPLFDYDPAFRFTCGVLPHHDQTVIVEAGRDGTVGMRPIARTRGLEDALGAELTLYWIEGYGGGLFLPFKDETNGVETYGGGRYLLDGSKGADLGTTAEGRLILDFNFAYNPSCAHSADWVCPLPPPENTLPRPVEAGEQIQA